MVKESDKIFSNAALLAGVLRERKQNDEKPVFTNGCFDLIHIGHTRYLQEAREAGDCLIIGVNSDESVRRLKGDKRPITPLDERLEVLASLQCVDYVIPFEELDPYHLIAALKPSILIKGGDWPIEEIVGREIVETLGGSVFTVPVVEGQSTSHIIRRIVDRHSSRDQ